jgi:hypothetical protein
LIKVKEIGKLVAFLFIASPSFAHEAPPRANTSEWTLNLLVIGSERYDFEGGAAARNDGGSGFGGSLARNLNNHFALGAEITYTHFDYRASVAPGAGNAGAGYDVDGSMETIALRLQATWYLLSGRITPFLTGAAGVNFLDPEFVARPPANACWIYPWYGQVCSPDLPRTTLTRLAYGAAAGLRVDLPGRQGFVRALVGGEWIDFSEASSPLGYLQVRADFGVSF